MIKIIAGKYKNRKLKYFNIQSVRPTQARVRKSMFDTLGNIENKEVLDLFCGIGTIGIEALSRGADSVCFIDHNIKFQEVYMSLAEDIAEKLSENWRQRFCKYIPSRQTTEMESVQRCAVLVPDSSFVNSWYKRKFSLDYSSLHWLLGQDKNSDR